MAAMSCVAEAECRSQWETTELLKFDRFVI